MLKYLYIILFSSVIYADYFPINSATSEVFTIDIIPPQLDISSPSNGDHFELESNIPVEWSSFDDSNFPIDAVTIELSTTILPYNYQVVIDSIENNNFAIIPTVNINTNTASLKVFITDYYGNQSMRASEGFFSIGNDLSFIDTTAVSSSYTIFTIDQIDPEIIWTYPNGGEEFNVGDSVELQWDSFDDSFDSTDVIIEFSEQTGADYIVQFSDIPHNEFENFIIPNLSTSTAQFRITAIDHYGNQNQDTQDGYFSIQSLELAFSDTLALSIGSSEHFIIDQIAPELEWIYPNGGEQFSAQDNITTEWTAIDSSWDNTDITIYLSPQSGYDFEEIATDISNTGFFIMTLPNIATESAQFKIFATDSYGNHNTDFANGTFLIGSMENIFSDTLAISLSISDPFIVDQIPPDIDLIHPNGGEHLLNYDNIHVQYNLIEDNNHGNSIQFWVSHELGGWFVDLGEHSADQEMLMVDFSHDGQIPERVYGFLKAQITDYFGNQSSFEYSDDYFILGDPQGTINANYINETSKEIILDWAWIEDQTIVIKDDVITALLDQGFDFIKVYDVNGIHTANCNSEQYSGLVELAHVNLQAIEREAILTFPKGIDYCDLGGARIPGYLLNHEIMFSTGVLNEIEYSLIPTSQQLLGDIMLFDNSTYIIDSFTLHSTLNNEPLYSISDERDWDSFNVYGKVTNHQGSSTQMMDFNNFNNTRIANNYSDNITFTRECNNDGICQEGESLVDCYTDCCSIPGTGENDEWCLLETVEGISNFQDNMNNGNYVPYIPANTSTATINFRVWLLNNNNEEVVKSIDTEINYEASNLYCEGDGDVNGDDLINIVDVVSIISHILEQFIIEDLVLLCEADLNSDGLVNIIDIVELVDIILQ